MKRLSLIASALAVLGLTACEKGLVEDIADVSATSQVTNSVLQVRTRSGGMAGSATTRSNYGGGTTTNYYDQYGGSIGSSTTRKNYGGGTTTTYYDAYGNSIGSSYGR